MDKTTLKRRPILQWLAAHAHTVKLLHALRGNYTEVLYFDDSREVIAYPARRLLEVLPHLLQLRKGYYCHPNTAPQYTHLVSRRRKTNIQNTLKIKIKNEKRNRTHRARRTSGSL